MANLLLYLFDTLGIFWLEIFHPESEFVKLKSMDKILERRHKWEEKHQLSKFFLCFKLAGLVPQSRHHEKELDDEGGPHEEGCRGPKNVSSVVEVNASVKVCSNIRARKKCIEEEEDAKLYKILEKGADRFGCAGSSLRTSVDQVRATVSCSSEGKYSVGHLDSELISLTWNFQFRLQMISGEASQSRLVVKE